MDKISIILLFITSGAFSTLITMGIGWLKDMHEEKRQEQKRFSKLQEESYRKVMANIDFVYQGTDQVQQMHKKNIFLSNYRIMFLYADDDIIRAVNNILDIQTTYPKDTKEMQDKKRRISQSIIALRTKTVKSTKLTEDDFRHAT